MTLIRAWWSVEDERAHQRYMETFYEMKQEEELRMLALIVCGVIGLVAGCALAILVEGIIR